MDEKKISPGRNFANKHIFLFGLSFTQMRFYCSKDGTIIDMITTSDEKGSAVVDYLTSNSTAYLRHVSLSVHMATTS